MKLRTLIGIVIGVVLANVVMHYFVLRFDLTDDKRYSLTPTTKSVLKQTKQRGQEIEVDIYLSGELNASFAHLQQSAKDLLSEMSKYGEVEYRVVDADSEKEIDQRRWQRLYEMMPRYNFIPTEIYETTRKGQSRQTIVYPFACVSIGGRSTLVSLLDNNRALTATENLDNSISSLEYKLMLAVNMLSEKTNKKVCFIEGHGELSEEQTYDLQTHLARYADVYFGTIQNDMGCLDMFDCIVIADPQEKFSDVEKYVIDQYIMSGGSVLWALNGIRLSEEFLSANGFTPIIPLDLNLQDMLFRYGVRVNPTIVTDMRCTKIQVDISQDPTQPHYEMMPWIYSPLVMAESMNPITYNLMPVNMTFASSIDLVGEGEGQRRSVLLSSSEVSHVASAPSEINLNELETDAAYYNAQLIPTAVLIEGNFKSLFEHRIEPAGLTNRREKAKSGISKQIFISAGSTLANDWQGGQPLALGYDRYSRIQWGNRDFAINAILYLLDDGHLMSLREKHIQQRPLNDKQVQSKIGTVQAVSIVVPVLLLATIAIVIMTIRKRKYAR